MSRMPEDDTTDKGQTGRAWIFADRYYTIVRCQNLEIELPDIDQKKAFTT